MWKPLVTNLTVRGIDTRFRFRSASCLPKLGKAVEIASAGCILSTSMPHGLGLPCHFTKLNRSTMTATTHTSSHQIEHEIKLVKRSSATAIHLLEAGAGAFSALARVLLWGTSVVAIDPAEACAGCQAHLPILQSTFTFRDASGRALASTARLGLRPPDCMQR